MANKLYASFNYFDLYLTRKDVDSMPLSGQCDDAVKIIAKKPYIVRQFNAIDNSKLIKELTEYGAWDEIELQDKRANIERVIWIACSDIKENEFMGCE
jgi:glutaredoxin-related protein